QSSLGPFLRPDENVIQWYVILSFHEYMRIIPVWPPNKIIDVDTGLRISNISMRRREHVPLASKRPLCEQMKGENTTPKTTIPLSDRLNGQQIEKMYPMKRFSDLIN